MNEAVSRQPAAYNPRTVFVAACLAILVFGVMMTILGSILPGVFERYDVSGADAGTLFLVMTLGMLVGSLVFGPLVDMLGYKPIMISFTALIVIGLEGIAFAPSFQLLRISLAIIGLGGGVINGGANALVADIATEGKSANLSLLGVFFGIGAFGVPFVIGRLLDFLSYTAIIAAIGALVVIPVVFFIPVTFPAPKHKQGFPLSEGLGLIKNPAMLLLGFILFFESGMEMTTGGWTSTFFTRVLDIPPDRAVQYLSLYWLGMMAARLILNRVLAFVSPARVLLASYAVAFAGSLCVVSATTPVTATVGVVLLGAGFAAVFPVILGYIGEMYPDISGTAFSVAFTMALTGGMSIPYIAGLIGDIAGVRLSFLVVTLGLVFAAGLFTVFLKSSKSTS